MTLTPSWQWQSQQWKEGGRGGIADHCHHRRKMTRRRKAYKGAQAAATKTTVAVEENEAETIVVIDIRGTNDGTDDPEASKDGSDGNGDGDGDGDGDDGDGEGDGGGNGDGDSDSDTAMVTADGEGGAMLANELVCSAFYLPMGMGKIHWREEGNLNFILIENGV